MHVSIGENETRSCNVEGCENTRCKMSQYCSFHYGRDQRWNDPKFKYPSQRQTEYQRKLAHQIIKANIQHPSIENAMRTLETIVMSVAAHKDDSLARHARRLVSGFNSQRALQNILVFWLWYWQVGLRLHSIQNDLSVRDALVGNALLKCAPLSDGVKRMKSPSGRVRKYFGEIIVKELQPLLTALSERIEKQIALEVAARKAQERAEREKITLHYPSKVINLAHKVLEQELQTTNL